MIVGLDCVAPEIVFDDMRSELPVLSGLMERGAWGKLESCDPPITVPAWSCMMSSKDPGTLGFYGFRNRKDHSYDGMAFATSEKVRADRLWDILSRAGKHVVALGVPQTFPPRQVNGEMVSCFLTPSTDSRYTYPEALKEEIREVVGDYMVDVPDYRTDDRERVVRDIHTMTERRFSPATCATRGRGTSSCSSRWAPTACTTRCGGSTTRTTPTTCRGRRSRPPSATTTATSTPRSAR
jgi:predicted AlkP superfamily phosphohydrolase/phosphomutase